MLIRHQKVIQPYGSERLNHPGQRKIRLFQKNGYIAVDFAQREIIHIHQTNRSNDGLIPGMEVHQSCFPEGDALEAELHSFASAVGACREPVVTGRMGYQALEVALNVMAQIDEATRRFGDM